MPKRFITNEQIDFLKENYNSFSNKQIGEKFNWTRGQVEHYLSVFNLKRDDIGKFRRKYSVNEHFFDNWTPESAYVLGFITGDGSLDKNQYCLSIYLAVKDIQILKDIKQIMSCTAPIKIKIDHSKKNYGKKYCNLRISSKIIFDRLNILGVIRRKTGKEIYPDVPDDFKYDYLRGIFDADGTITMTKKNQARNFTIYSASKIYLETLSKAFNFGYIYSKHKGKCYGLITQNRPDLQKLFSSLYKPDHTLYLKRKHKRFIDVLQSYKTKMVLVP